MRSRRPRLRRSVHTLGLLFMTCLLLAITATAGWADTLKVPDDYRDLEDALRNADRGDVIEITRSRTFRESLSLRNVRDLTITVGRSARNVVVQGRRVSDPVIELINCRDITIEGLTIQSGSVGIDVRSGGTDIVIRECILQQNVTSGITGYDYTLEGCSVIDNGAWGVELIGDPTNPDEAEITLIDTQVQRNFSGGLRVQSAIAHLESSTFSGNLGYGLLIDGEATVDFEEGAGITQIRENRLGGVLVTNASFTLQGTALVTANLGPGIVAERATLVVDGAEVRDHEDIGIVYRQSQGSIRNSLVTENAGTGVVVDESSTVEISGSTISSQGEYGVVVIHESAVTIRNDSQIIGNTLAGLILDATRGTVSDSNIAGNGESGIDLLNGAQATLTGATVLANLANGVRVDASTLSVAGGEIGENGKSGILVLPGSTALIAEGALVQANGEDGVLIQEATAEVRGATVQINVRDGVRVVGVATADVRGAQIQDNAANGITANDQAAVLVSEASQIVGNGNHGLSLFAASATVDASNVSDNAVHGAYATAESILVVRNGSTFLSNGASGILGEEASSVEIYDAEVRSNGLHGVQLIDAEARVERTLVADQTGNGLDLAGSFAFVSDCDILDNGEQGVYELQSRLSLADSTVAGNVLNGVLLDNAVAEIARCSIDSNGIHGISGINNSSATVTETVLSSHPEDGVALENSAGDFLASDIIDNLQHGVFAEVSTLVMEDCLLARNVLNGASLLNSTGDFASCRIENNLQQGVGLQDSTGSFVTCSVTDQSQEGLVLVNAAAAVSDSNIDRNQSIGMTATNSVIAMDGGSVKENRGSGVQLSNASLNADGVLFNHNAGYGISATSSGAGLDTCEVVGNGLDGIWQSFSQVSAEQTAISDNGLSAVNAQERSRITLLQCEVADHSQPAIVLSDSTADVRASSIRDSLAGILATRSVIQLVDESVVSGHD
nr:right-handed parallel beta-helix repeat-containing protein [Candidatus Bipolaricaulota bacterium]